MRRRRGAAAAGEVARTSVNDVVLATLTGGLRAWLLTRGQPVPPTAVVRALVPMSVQVADPKEAGAIGSRVASLLVSTVDANGPIWSSEMANATRP